MDDFYDRLGEAVPELLGRGVRTIRVSRQRFDGMVGRYRVGPIRIEARDGDRVFVGAIEVVADGDVADDMWEAVEA